MTAIDRVGCWKINVTTNGCVLIPKVKVLRRRRVVVRSIGMDSGSRRWLIEASLVRLRVAVRPRRALLHISSTNNKMDNELEIVMQSLEDGMNAIEKRW
jgi:hypothetical protein